MTELSDVGGVGGGGGSGGVRIERQGEGLRWLLRVGRSGGTAVIRWI